MKLEMIGGSKDGELYEWEPPSSITFTDFEMPEADSEIYVLKSRHDGTAYLLFDGTCKAEVEE